LIYLEDDERRITNNIQQTAIAYRHFRKSSAKSSQQCAVAYVKKLSIRDQGELAFLHFFISPPFGGSIYG
jgi:hypothetical protein